MAQVTVKEEGPGFLRRLLPHGAMVAAVLFCVFSLVFLEDLVSTAQQVAGGSATAERVDMSQNIAGFAGFRIDTMHLGWLAWVGIIIVYIVVNPAVGISSWVSLVNRFTGKKSVRFTEQAKETTTTTTERVPRATEVGEKVTKMCKPKKLDAVEKKVIVQEDAVVDEPLHEVVTPTNKVTMSSKYDNTPTKMSPNLKQRMSFRKIASSENFTPIHKVNKDRDVEDFLAARMKTVSPTQELKMKESELKDEVEEKIEIIIFEK